MNDIKYVMLPRIEEKEKEIKRQPWYKERMREKYITKSVTERREREKKNERRTEVKNGKRCIKYEGEKDRNVYQIWTTETRKENGPQYASKQSEKETEE